MDFLNSVENEKRKSDALVVLDLMKTITKLEPKMLGNSLVGFGSYHYKYASGREGDWPFTAFSPRKQNLTIYIMDGFQNHQDLLNQLGKYSTGKSCLYIKKLEDVDHKILEKLIISSFNRMNKKYK